MSEQVGQGEKGPSDRCASMNVEKAPGKNLNGGTIKPNPTSENVGGKASGSMGYKSFDK